jgi:hypothetical protein
MSQALQEPPGTEPLGNRDQTDATVVAESQRTPECFAVLFDRHAPASTGTPPAASAPTLRMTW